MTNEIIGKIYGSWVELNISGKSVIAITPML